MEDLFTPVGDLQKVLDKEFENGKENLKETNESESPGLIRRIRNAISDIFLVVIVFVLVANPFSVGKLTQMFGVEISEASEEKKLGLKGFGIQTLVFACLVSLVKFANYYDFI
jgi:hypothetical protein